MDDATRTTETPAHRTVRVSWKAAWLAVAAVIAFMVLRDAFVAAHRVLGWTAAAVVVAAVIEPFTGAVGRYVPRILAVLGTFLVLAAAVGSAVIGSIDDLDREVARLRAATPEAVERLIERDDEVGGVARELNLDERAVTFVDLLDDRVGSASDALVDNAESAPVYLVAAILTLFLLVYGPQIATGAVNQLSDERRRRMVTEVVQAALPRARRALVALLAQGVVVGGLVGTASWLLDLPAPIVLGLIAAVLATLPDVGIVMGVVPTAALAIAFESLTAATVIFVVAIAVQVFEAVAIRRWAGAVGTDVGPAVVWIVALLGYAIYGPGMAFYGVVVAIFGLAVIDEIPAVRDEG